jgi:hypothetical protein
MGSSRIAGIAALGLGLMATAANADPINPAVLVPALDVYVDAATADHAAGLACANPQSRARDEGDWNAAKAIFIATLWANAFPTDFVKGAAARFDATPSVKPDCSDKDTLERIRDPDHEGWPAYLAHALSGMDLKPVLPVAPERWQAIKDAIAERLPMQKRTLDCLAVVSPEFLPVAVHDWDQMLAGIGSKLASAGLPRDEVAATIGAAEANALWKRAAAGDIAAIKADCAKDLVWSDYFFQLGFINLAGDVDKLLPPPSSDNN